MTEEDSSQDTLEPLVQYVAEQLTAGTPKRVIINDLVNKGLNASEAELFVNNLDNIRHQAINEARKQAGIKDLGCGLTMLIVGLAITLGTWSAAKAGGSYWVMWGAIVFGAFYILRGLYRKITTATEGGTRGMWILVGIILIGGMVGGGAAITNMMNPPELTPPSDSFIVTEDNLFWEDEIQSILSASGTIKSTHSQWSIKNVEVEVRALDETGKMMNTYTIPVVPSSITPGGMGIYSKRLQRPYDCASADSTLVWEWVPP